MKEKLTKTTIIKKDISRSKYIKKTLTKVVYN